MTNTGQMPLKYQHIDPQPQPIIPPNGTRMCANNQKTNTPPPSRLTLTYSTFHFLSVWHISTPSRSSLQLSYHGKTPQIGECKDGRNGARTQNIFPHYNPISKMPEFAHPFAHATLGRLNWRGANCLTGKDAHEVRGPPHQLTVA